MLNNPEVYVSVGTLTVCLVLNLVKVIGFSVGE